MNKPMLQDMRPVQQTLYLSLMGLMTVMVFCLVSVLWSASVSGNIQDTTSVSPDVLYSDASDSPNAVTRVIGTPFNWTTRHLASLTTVPHWPGTVVDKTSSVVARGGKSVGGGVAHGVTASGHAIGNSAMFAARIPASTVHAIGDFSFVSFIRPANNDRLQQITPATTNSSAPAAVAQTAQQNTPAEVPSWPIHGRITTLFGAPDLPYQLVHTGIDISDGQRAGVAPVHPFKSGKVIEAVHSNVKLGNHVVIDHGNGLTSIYAHMASISVTVGQEVNQSTVLGREGSTGDSTGPHVHFEIRQDNKPMNPQLYIRGKP